jgi:predicted dehydrogenase
MQKIHRAAIVGLGFGAEFIPIYQHHPSAELAAVCQRNPHRLEQIRRAFDIERGYTDFH